MYVEDRRKVSALAPQLYMLFVDPRLPQGSDRTFVADLATIAAYFATPGPAGKSAYDLAVADGSTMSLSDWLGSLKGQKGDPGLKGDQGPPGVANCRNARVPIGSGLLGPNAVQPLRVTWPTPFEDDRYTISHSFESASLLGGIRVEVRARNKAYVDLAVANGLISLTMSAVLLHVTATHDA